MNMIGRGLAICTECAVFDRPRRAWLIIERSARASSYDLFMSHTEGRPE